MENHSLLVKCVFALLFLAGFSFAANCALNAYHESCVMCSFDANGTMNQTCYQAKQAAGTACVSTNYPITAAKYAAGQCPQIDACANALTACKAQASTGNDSADCQDLGVESCFTTADRCVVKADAECNPQPICPSSTGMVIAVVGVIFAAAYFRKQ